MVEDKLGEENLFVDGVENYRFVKDLAKYAKDLAISNNLDFQLAAGYTYGMVRMTNIPVSSVSGKNDYDRYDRIEKALKDFRKIIGEEFGVSV